MQSTGTSGVTTLISETASTPSGSSREGWPQRVDLFGVRVSLTDYEQLTEITLRSCEMGLSAVVSCHAVHAIVTASSDSELCRMVNTFHAIAPDGQPVRWALNWFHSGGLTDRVYGPEFMLRLCQGAADRQVPIFLYGASQATLNALTYNLCERFPELRIVGSYSPPYRELTAEEDQAVVDAINQSEAKLVFIGLGCPKQDRFAYAHRESIRAVQVCVGAAFDFHAGVLPTAPPWMQRNGLEWVFRLWREPGRLWKRYLITNSVFLFKVFTGLIGCWRPKQNGPQSSPLAAD
jgi:N-acetylglucosaminyldiphosphoundecaprenol N-acetyl-beta-D-mannosaminyltransferase